jgi:nucleoside-diphosphate-sugar epimerase
MSTVLVTGDRGYIGSVLVKVLIAKGYEVVGYDIGYFQYCNLSSEVKNYKRITKDIRDIVEEDLAGIDSIIHLAALSNDPLGELSPGITETINYHGSLHIARLAKKSGIKRFVYASSQSMYGVSDSENELDEDDSEKKPLTAYAKTKWLAECELKKLNDENFTVVCFRPSTVFGVSPRLRCDIVFNNLVACAYTTGAIEIKSDGTPWRPIVHIQDVCSAFLAGLKAPKSLVSGKSYNVGLPNGNYTVRELAEAAKKAVPGSRLIFTGEHGADSRTYKVSFSRILNELKDYYMPEWNLDAGGSELVKYFSEVGFTIEDFRGKSCNRLSQLQYLKVNLLINDELRIKNN